MTKNITQGDVPIGGFYWKEGKRFKRIATSSVQPVGENGHCAGQALALIPDETVDRIEDAS